MDFMNRNLFAMGALFKGSKKGRAGTDEDGTGIAAGRSQIQSGFAKHSYECTKKLLGGKKFWQVPSVNHGITIEYNCGMESSKPYLPAERDCCTVEPDKQVLSIGGERQVKGGLYNSHMSDNIVGKHFQYCGAPFVAGVSGSIPQYMMFAMGSKAKVDSDKTTYDFKTALDDTELMALVGMLELAGFHSITELMYAVNFYRGMHLVLPPFDSGDFDVAAKTNITIVCRDKEHECCNKDEMIKNSHKINTKAYEAMVAQFAAAVKKWQPTGSFVQDGHGDSSGKDDSSSHGDSSSKGDVGGQGDGSSSKGKGNSNGKDDSSSHGESSSQSDWSSSIRGKGDSGHGDSRSNWSRD